MQHVDVIPKSANKGLIKVIIGSALLVGTLDILAAFIDFYISTGKNPLVIVSKYIASGVLGKQAFSGGTGTIILGLVFHYIIASLFTIFFFWCYPRLPFLSKNKLITGILYGVLVWSIMNLVVLPLSNIPPRPPMEFIKVLKSISILALMIGVPLSFIAYRFFKRTVM